MDESTSQQVAGQVTRRDFIEDGLKLGAGAAIGGSLLAAGTTQPARAATRRASSTGAVRFWVQPYGDPKAWNTLLEQNVAAFKKQTGITVHYEVIPWASALQKWDLAMGTGDVPDVGDMFYLQSRVLQGRGKWGPLDLTSHVKSGAFGDYQRFVPVARREAAYKGAVYGIPWRIDIRAFIYDSNLWPSVPATYNDFAQMASSAVTSKKLIAAAQTIGVPYQQLKVIAAAWGLEFLTPDLKHSTLMDPRWGQVCTWIQNMVNKRVLLQQAATNLTLPAFDNFLEGRVAVLLGGNHQVVPTAQGTAPRMVSKISSGLMPTGPAGKHFSIASTAQFSIFENTKAKAESLQWVRYLTSPAVNKQWSIVSGQDPSDTVVQNMLANAFTRAIYLQSRTAFGIDQPTPAWAEISASPTGPATKLAIDVFSGANVHTALSQAHTGIEAILAKYK